MRRNREARGFRFTVCRASAAESQVRLVQASYGFFRQFSRLIQSLRRTRFLPRVNTVFCPKPGYGGPAARHRDSRPEWRGNSNCGARSTARKAGLGNYRKSGGGSAGESAGIGQEIALLFKGDPQYGSYE